MKKVSCLTHTRDTRPAMHASSWQQSILIWYPFQWHQRSLLKLHLHQNRCLFMQCPLGWSTKRCYSRGNLPSFLCLACCMPGCHTLGSFTQGATHKEGWLYTGEGFMHRETCILSSWSARNNWFLRRRFFLMVHVFGFALLNKLPNAAKKKLRSW